MSRSILVMGAGELGLAALSALAHHILRENASLTVLLRNSSSTIISKREFFTENRIAVSEFDVVGSSIEDLAVFFRKGQFETVIGCMGMQCLLGTQLNIAKAALLAGIRRYFPWQFGVDYDIIGRSSSQDLFTEQLDVRDLLRAQDSTKWYVVSTGMFMSFLFEEMFGVIKSFEGGWKVKGLGGWENKVTVTDVADIGKVIAELVYSAIGVGIYYTAGETISYRQLADVMGKLEGQGRVQREEWDLKSLRKELEDDPENGMKKYRIVFGEGKGVSWDSEKTFNHQRNMQMIKVEDWARQNLSTR